MGQSLVKDYKHIVFSTKYRQPLIQKPFADDFFKYLGGVCNELDCQSIIVGGYVDHVHVLCNQSKNITISKLVEKIKTSSSKWFKTLDVSLLNFYWQNGYGAFSVSPELLEQKINYIRNQEEHHKKKTFQEEYRIFLEEYGIEYDEKYVWD